MDNKTKILRGIFVLVIIATLVVLYMRFFVFKDFTVQTSQECDPSINICYVYVCDSEFDSECTGDLVSDTSYFEVVYKPAKEIEICNPAIEECSEIVCDDQDNGCSIEYCSEDLIESRGAVRCSDESDKQSSSKSEETEETQNEGEEAPETDATDVLES